MFEKCPCGSGKLYANCCKPYIKGKENAQTPEALMRSRYSAYVLHEIDYIIDTCKDKEKIDRSSVENWSNNSKWIGLEIISSDETGTVEFKAVYEQGHLIKVHYEIAYFLRQEEGRWMYSNGKIIPVSVIRSDTKQGRNEYCACGSGKKYKHCCGR
jgi:SEC-C motif-containing protein